MKKYLSIISLIIVAFCGKRFSEADPFDKKDNFLTLITAQNNANREIVHGFDVEYAFQVTQNGKLTTNKLGRYVLDRGRVFSHDQVFDPTSGSRIIGDLTFVSNGTTSRVADTSGRSPEIGRLLTLGTSGNKRLIPGSPGPFDRVLDGISFRLDHLLPTDPAVTEIGEEDINGEPCVRVTFNGTRSHAENLPNKMKLQVWYSKSNNYLPARCVGIEMSGEKIVNHMEGIFETLKFTVEGQPFYLTASSHEITTTTNITSGDFVEVRDYKINTKSIKLNPIVSDSLFSLPIQPRDQVINVDLDFEMNNPLGRDFMELEKSMTQPSDNNWSKMPSSILDHSKDGMQKSTLNVANSTSMQSLRNNWIMLLTGLTIFISVIALILFARKRRLLK